MFLVVPFTPCYDTIYFGLETKSTSSDPDGMSVDIWCVNMSVHAVMSCEVGHMSIEEEHVVCHPGTWRDDPSIWTGTVDLVECEWSWSCKTVSHFMPPDIAWSNRLPRDPRW